MGQRNQATLGCRVGLGLRLGLKRPGRCHINDGTLSFPKIRNRVFGHQKRPGQVHVQAALPLFKA